jgi:hypothetical protein
MHSRDLKRPLTGHSAMRRFGVSSNSLLTRALLFRQGNGGQNVEGLNECFLRQSLTNR